MGTEIIMLGTGHAMSTRCYNTCFLLHHDEEYILVDAGGGNEILRRLEYAGMDYRKLHSMILSHAHTDHILGAFWIIRKIANWMLADKYPDNFTVYCHDEIASMLPVMCQFMLTQKIMSLFGTRILIRQVSDGEQVMVSGLQLDFFDIHSTKQKQYGFQATLPNGQRLSFLGDEPFNEKNIKLIKGSDWLMSEAFCLYGDRNRYKPYEKNHSTALDAGRLAQELEAANLILYHTEDEHLDIRKKEYLEEASQEFAGNIHVPDDMEIIRIF